MKYNIPTNTIIPPVDTFPTISKPCGNFSITNCSIALTWLGQMLLKIDENTNPIKIARSQDREVIPKPPIFSSISSAFFSFLRAKNLIKTEIRK